MKDDNKPVFNRHSRIYNITYTTGQGAYANTFRFKLGQMLNGIDSCVYDIVETHVRGAKDSFFLERYTVYAYNFKTNEVSEYRQTSTFDELTFNIEYLAESYGKK